MRAAPRHISPAFRSSPVSLPPKGWHSSEPRNSWSAVVIVMRIVSSAEADSRRLSQRVVYAPQSISTRHVMTVLPLGETVAV